jgi:hypothetical protein
MNQEYGCTSFFISVGALCAQAAGLDVLKRRWIAYGDRGLGGISTYRKPYIILFDNSTNDTPLSPSIVLRLSLKKGSLDNGTIPIA